MERSRTRGPGRLGQALVEAGWVSESDLRKALALQADFGGRLGTNLLEIGAVRESELLAVLGRVRRTQTVDAEALRSVPRDVLRMVPPKLAGRFAVVPYKRSGGSLLVAGVDPGDAVVEDELSTITGHLVRTVLGLEIRVLAALEKHYGLPQSVRLTALSHRLDGHSGAIERPDRPSPGTATADAPAALGTPPDAKTPATPVAERAVARRRPRKVERAQPMREIELSDDDRDRIFGKSGPIAIPAEPAPQRDTELADPRDRLHAASEALARAEMRDDVADALIAFCGVDFERIILFIRRGDQILGWRGHGDPLTAKAVRAIQIDAAAPSLFANLRASRQVWSGPLPPFPCQSTLVEALGGAPASCFMAPIEVRDKVIAFLYADNAARGVDDVPLAHLERLAKKAGLALEVALLKNKIRTV